MHFLRGHFIGRDFQVFGFTPLSGMIAWYSRSRACLADPCRVPFHRKQLGTVKDPARYSPPAYPATQDRWRAFLRTTFFAARRRRCALEIAISASISAA